MLIDSSEPFNTQDLLEAVFDAKILVTEFKVNQSYLSIEYDTLDETFNVFFQDENNDPIIHEKLEAEEAVNYYNKILKTEILNK